MIPYGKQSISDDDIAAVANVLRSDFLTCGPEVDAFEREFASMVGAKHAVAVCNATAALHLAMLIAKIGPGERVVTSPNTFVSSANCAAFVGATPDFCDIDPITYNLCPEALARDWQDDTKAVVAVAYAGQPADMPAIAEIAHARGAIVIEDGCHGTGGGFTHQGKDYKIGGHPWADMTTFSFHPVKTMTTGEGGILVTDNDQFAQTARLLRSHGITRDHEEFIGLGSKELCLAGHGPWYYEMQHLGYNFRITDLQCALGRSQLKKLPGFIKRRQEIVDHYNKAFQDLPWLTPPGVQYERDRDEISWHLYTTQINFEELGKTRSEVMLELREQEIGTQVLYIPVYLQPWYRETYGYVAGKCPNSEAYYSKALSLPMYPSMTDSDIECVIAAVKRIVSKRST
ncbi:UDP-4-amino-4,6-dideoxy-N-acetyl-beta-L-altrosamine transaminase [Akkermansiaceae bacterium]|nr:UDP-4-amino-4,6-dideoxy-N-acetyl-beta-L-altrosamine transaminase [Akkermansiaceae bacterium]MDB4740016.1 UDP-4-amino-4,6-dideoxy-N-acetyl-beta-L-altrosamine transaminase [Akkermansiaceae bacterium]